MRKILILVLSVFAMQITFAQETESKEKIQEGLVFESLEHNYGDIEKGGNGVCEFKFTNSSDTPAILSSVKASCGCTSPAWPREPIAPGATATIKVKYDTNRIGSFAKYIYVYSNKSASPIKLTIRGKVLTVPAQ